MRRERQQFQARKGKQTIFRTMTAGRNSKVYQLTGDLIFKLSSYPSYIAENSIRRNFGERYYNFSVAIIISLLLLYPYFFAGSQVRDFLGVSWIIFILFFLYKSIRHRMEFRRFSMDYNYDRFSYSDGEIFPFWYTLIGRKILGITVTRYLILVLFEPALPILTGLFLMLLPFTRAVGALIFISGLFFCYRNIMKAYAARGYVLDMIDEQITAQWQHDVIMEEKPKSETAGLSFPIELPKDKNLRMEMIKSMEEENLSSI